MELEIVGGNYVELDGISGGQTIIGGTDASDNLTLKSTSHATKGKILADDDLETTSTKGIIVPVSNTYAFSRAGDPDTGLYFNATLSRFEFHRDGNIAGVINAEDPLAYGFYSPTSPALLIPNNSYAFAQAASTTTGVYFDNSAGNMEFDLVGVAKHTFEMVTGHYTPGGNIYLKGNTLYGNIVSGGDLTLGSTSHATKGKILFGSSAYDEVNNRLGIGTTTPGEDLEIYGATPIIKLNVNVAGYNADYSYLGTTYNFGAAEVSDNVAFTIAGGGSWTTGGGIIFTTGNSGTVKFDKDGNVGLGLTPTANMAGISIEAGIITLKETTTPTADTNYGKIYTKNDNKFYAQDGAGVEHELAYA